MDRNHGSESSDSDSDNALSKKRPTADPEDGENIDNHCDYDVIINLGNAGEPGSGFRTRNDPAAPFQRDVVLDRRGIMEVCCRSCEVIHGRLEPDTGKYASLLVYDVSFGTVKKSRRVNWAKIEFKFASSKVGGRAPEIVSIAPAGRVGLLPSTRDKTVRKLGNLTAGVPELLGKFEVSVEWEETTNQTTSDSARVIGNTLCDDYGRQVGVSWIMEENTILRSGVPSLLRCAMLVGRADNSPFECDVTIDAKADWKTTLGLRLTGSTETDDPVYFDPQLPPTSRLRGSEGYDAQSLSSVDLKGLVSIRFETLYSS